MKAEKDGKNPHFRSDYMTLDGILNKVKPILAEVNIGVMQTIETSDRDVTCTTILLHDSGQVITGTATVHADKDTPQGFGSAIPYARRYGIASLLGIADCEDDDGNKAEEAAKKVSKSTPKKAVVAEPKPAPAPVSKVETKETVKETKSLLTDKQQEQILNAFDVNLKINVNELETIAGPVETWTTDTRKSLLKSYNDLTSKVITKEKFLEQ